MPKLEGVYQDRNGRWYFKATTGADPLTGARVQITRRGYASALAASRARRAVLDERERGPVRAAGATLTVNDLLDVYLDGLDADQRLSPKTRFDYRKNADAYVRPWLGGRRAKDVTAESVVLWQRELSRVGSVKSHGPLEPNTIRLARAPLAGAYRMAVAQGLLPANPVKAAPSPRPARRVPGYWTPEQAKAFLASQHTDRMYPCWAFLIGTGLRIGELARLRWVNVDLPAGRLRVVEFVSTLGYQVVASTGKSRTAVRTVDLDTELVSVLERQRRQQQRERIGVEHVFANPSGEPYHPQTLSKLLARLSAASGLPRLTAHGLRHTSATLMLNAGVPPKVAAERLGHSDPMLFLNLYGHVTAAMQRDAAERIGASLFR